MLEDNSKRLEVSQFKTANIALLPKPNEHSTRVRAHTVLQITATSSHKCWAQLEVLASS